MTSAVSIGQCLVSSPPVRSRVSTEEEPVGDVAALGLLLDLLLQGGQPRLHQVHVLEEQGGQGRTTSVVGAEEEEGASVGGSGTGRFRDRRVMDKKSMVGISKRIRKRISSRTSKVKNGKSSRRSTVRSRRRSSRRCLL